MQRKLLRIAGFYGMLFATFGAFLAGCVEEPFIPKVERMMTSTRFVNVCVDQPAVDIWVDSLRFDNIPYKGHLPYTDIPSGSHFFRVTAVGADTSEAFLRGEVFFRSLTQTSVIVYGRSNVLQPNDSGRIGVTITQERFTYSDETAKLPSDTGKIKLINCVVSRLPDVKFGSSVGLNLYDTVLVADSAVVSNRIQRVLGPPAKPDEFPNLSAYVKYPVGEHRFGVFVGTSLKFLPREGTAEPGPIVENIESRFYTYIVTGIDNDQSTWDLVRLTDQ